MSKALDNLRHSLRHDLRHSRRLTLLLGIVALLVSGFLASQPPKALAATLSPQVCTYYSDASLTVIVGRATLRCGGAIVQKTGTITSYRVCQYDYCCGSVWC